MDDILVVGKVVMVRIMIIQYEDFYKYMHMGKPETA